MILTLIVILVSFLLLLLYYQRQDKIYIGYTTVLSLLFSAILIVLIVICGLSENPKQYSFWILASIVWVLGSVVIYITSQLTLAFEKIHQLSQYIAHKELDQSSEKD